MFEQLKQLKKMQEIQAIVKNERADYEKSGIKVVVNGNLEIEDITLNPELGIADQERALKDAVNEAMKKVKMAVARKMQSMGGLGM